MLKALSVQVQPDRAPGLEIEEVRAAFEAIAQMAPLVRRHQFDAGFDKTHYLNFTFGTEDLKGLWSLIQSTIYSNSAFAESMAKASIVVCEGNDGWNDYLQIFHFDPDVPRDEIDAI